MLLHLVSSIERRVWSEMNLQMEVEEGSALVHGSISDLHSFLGRKGVDWMASARRGACFKWIRKGKRENALVLATIDDHKKKRAKVLIFPHQHEK